MPQQASIKALIKQHADIKLSNFECLVGKAFLKNGNYTVVVVPPCNAVDKGGWAGKDSMERKKLTTKDLLNLGIFGTIYAVIMAIAGFSSAPAPFLLFIFMSIAAFVNGTVFMLYLTRVNRFGMVLLLGILMGLIMLAIGKSWTVMLATIVFGLLAEAILAWGDYKAPLQSVLAYAVFSLWFIGPLLPILWFTDEYYANVMGENGAEYANAFLNFFSVPVVAGFGALIFVMALAGGALGRVLIKKHFTKAGLVQNSQTGSKK